VIPPSDGDYFQEPLLEDEFVLFRFKLTFWRGSPNGRLKRPLQAIQLTFCHRLKCGGNYLDTVQFDPELALGTLTPTFSPANRSQQMRCASIGRNDVFTPTCEGGFVQEF
jgi:hypothetical protein